MDLYEAARAGCFRLLKSVALPSVAAAAAVFADAPADTRVIELSVYGGTLYLTYDGTTPVIGSAGHSFDPGSYDLCLSVDVASKTQGIGSGVSGYVTYWGTNG